MNKIFTLLLASALVIITVTCRTNNHSIVPSIGQKGGFADLEDKSCLHIGKLSVAQRLNQYPFSRAAIIKLVSFNYDVNMTADDGYIFSKSFNRFQPIEFKEMTELTASGLDSLTDILYNYDYKAPPTPRNVPKCYRPRNGIVFYDKDTTLFAAIEICFECQRFQTFPSQVQLPEQKSQTVDFCSQKSDLLRDFFKKAGILYGAKFH